MGRKGIAIYGDERMTVREVAEVLGVAPSTVRNIVGKHGWAKNGKTTYLGEKQIAIISHELKSGYSVAQQNEHSLPAASKLKTKAELFAEYYALSHEVVEFLQSENDRLHTELDEANHSIDLYEKHRIGLETRLDANARWQSVKKYCRRHGLDYSLSELKAIGKDLAVICRRKGITPKKVDDSNYGFVNAYPVDLLDDYFEDELED